MNNLIKKEPEKFTVGLKITAYNHNLRQARIDYGYKTVTAFAKDIGITANHLCAFETMRSYPSFDTASKIASHLGRDVQDLFPDILKKLSKKRLKSLYMAQDAYISSVNHEPIVNLSLLQEEMSNMLQTLDRRERNVLKMRFYENRTLEDIGRAIGITSETVRRIQDIALRKLRHPVRSRHIKPFLYQI